MTSSDSEAVAGTISPIVNRVFTTSAAVRPVLSATSWAVAPRVSLSGGRVGAAAGVGAAGGAGCAAAGGVDAGAGAGGAAAWPLPDAADCSGSDTGSGAGVGLRSGSGSTAWALGFAPGT